MKLTRFKSRPPRIVATAEDLVGVRSTDTVVLVGEAVTAQLGGVAIGGPYINQKQRRLSRGLAAMKVYAQVGVREDLAAAMKPLRWLDVRLAYDRYFAHVMAQNGDVVLLAGSPVPGGTWVTEIVKTGSAVSSINEARLDDMQHPAFLSDLLTRLSQAANRNPTAEIHVALAGFNVPAQQNYRDLGASLQGSPKLAGVDIGRPVLPGKLLVIPAIAILGALGYGALGLQAAEAKVIKQRNAYSVAIRGVEEDFKVGLPRVERLEARSAFLTAQESRSNIVSDLRRLLGAASMAGESILQRASFAQKEGQSVFKLRIAVLPDVAQDPVVQFTPFVERLATNYGAPVRITRYSDDRFAPISTTIAFRSYELAGQAAPVESPAAEAEVKQ